MERQPLVVQTLYAELMEQMLALEAGRSIGDVVMLAGGRSTTSA